MSTQKFKRFLWSSAQVKLIPEFGWNDGGCLILAMALREWSRNELVIQAVWREQKPLKPIIQHFVCYSDKTDRYIDADGVMTKQGLLLWKMANLEHVPDCYVNADFSIELVIKEGEIPHDLNASSILAKRIESKFGSFSQARIHLEL